MSSTPLACGGDTDVLATVPSEQGFQWFTLEETRPVRQCKVEPCSYKCGGRITQVVPKQTQCVTQRTTPRRQNSPIDGVENICIFFFTAVDSGEEKRKTEIVLLSTQVCLLVDAGISPAPSGSVVCSRGLLQPGKVHLFRYVSVFPDKPPGDKSSSSDGRFTLNEKRKVCLLLISSCLPRGKHRGKL